MKELIKVNNQRKANDQTDIYINSQRRLSLLKDTKEIKTVDAAGLRRKNTSIIYDGNLEVMPKNKVIRFKPGDKVKTIYGIGEVLQVEMLCKASSHLNKRAIFKYLVQINNSEFCLNWMSWFAECQLEIYNNDEGEVKTMENKELDKIGQLALNIINKVRDYKIKSVQDECNKKIEEITKSTEVNKLVEAHTKLLQKDINKLLGRDSNNNDFTSLLKYSFVGTVNFKITDDYLTEDEKNKKQKVVDDLKNEEKQINDKFDNIVDSLYLCTTVDQINEFLDNQGFRVDGLIVNPENWKG